MKDWYVPLVLYREISTNVFSESMLMLGVIEILGVIRRKAETTAAPHPTILAARS
jgi:hypothetical protein